MNSDEIKSTLMELLENYDQVMKEWPNKKAAHEKMHELKKTTHSVLASHAQGSSEAERQRNAYKDSKYLDYIETANSASLEFYKLDAKKLAIEKKLGILQSLLSFEKAFIEKTI